MASQGDAKHCLVASKPVLPGAASRRWALHLVSKVRSEVLQLNDLGLVPVGMF